MRFLASEFSQDRFINGIAENKLIMGMSQANIDIRGDQRLQDSP